MLTNSVLRACVAGRQAGAAELAVADLPSGMDCQLVGHIPLHAENSWPCTVAISGDRILRAAQHDISFGPRTV